MKLLLTKAIYRVEEPAIDCRTSRNGEEIADLSGHLVFEVESEKLLVQSSPSMDRGPSTSRL